MRIPLLVLLLLCLLGVAQAVWYAPQLPERVASSFAGDGTPREWGTRDAVLRGQVLILIGVAVLFPFLGWLLRRLPAGLISVPHPEYWLDPSRRATTLAAIGSSR